MRMAYIVCAVISPSARGLSAHAAINLINRGHEAKSFWSLVINNRLLKCSAFDGIVFFVPINYIYILGHIVIKYIIIAL